MTSTEGRKPITITDPRALEAEVERLRNRLAGTVDELSGRVTPAAIKQRSIARVRAAVNDFATDEYGGLRVERVAAVGLAVTGVVAIVVIRAVRKRR
ncbi:DUF3618 domain-containing protein [Kineococcus gynurae]|uniref:DUF3618 domain-containing protein n=1 Tax=Kineococcus gynurae TaxID=452979 RepID=A0ABV5LX26_9ACTN